MSISRHRLTAGMPHAQFDRMSIHQITPDHVYGTVRDEMDIQYVVRLSIRKPEG